MNYNFHLSGESFDAIKSGKKKIETRIETENHHKEQFEGMKVGEEVVFTKESTGEIMVTEIQKIRHYPDIASLLDHEGQDRVMSYDTSREEALVSWNTLKGYEEGIKKHGIWAIEVKLI